jgi:hypothetical protein
MTTPHDALAKDILDVMLDDLGTLEREFEVPALKAQRADLRFAPSPKHILARHALGLLGRMTDAPCLFEPFYGAPSYDEVQACLRKLLNAMHAGVLTPSRAVECAWLLCGGRPDTALARFDALPMRGWPAGFYTLRGSPLVVVVLSELPLTDDSVALRLMGAGATMKRAFDDLCARYGTLPQARRLIELMVQDTVLTHGERVGQENTMVDTTAGREIIKRLMNEGRSEGRIEGELRASLRNFERRLSRALTPAEQATLSARFRTLGPDRLCDLAFDLDAAALAAWLADPAAT